MSAKSIFEADGKAILNYHLTRAPVIKPTPLPPSATHNPAPRLASLHFPQDKAVKDVLDQAEVTYPWLLQDGAKFVAKPDQLIKRRGKSGLLCLNKPWAEARQWVEERAGKPQKVEHVEGVLRQFLVEPFVPHAQDTEYYININSAREVSRHLFVVLFDSVGSSMCRRKCLACRKKVAVLGGRVQKHVRWLGPMSILNASGRKEITQPRHDGPTPTKDYPPHLASLWSALHSYLRLAWSGTSFTSCPCCTSRSVHACGCSRSRSLNPY